MRKTHLRQFFTALSGYLVSFNFGAASSWASLSFEDLQKNPSILSFGALDINEASMMVTLANLGGLIGNFLFLPIGEIYGHKRITLWLGPIQIVSWLLVIYPQNIYYLYAGRILCGLSAGATNNSIPLFITEISDYKIRAALNTLNTFAYSTGILLGFVLGLYFDYRMQGIILLFVPIIFMATFAFFPESPVYLKKKEKEKRLRKSIKFYEGSKAIAILNKAEEGANDLNEKNEVEPEAEPEAAAKLTLQDFLHPAARKATLVTLFLVMIQQLSGNIVLLSYTASVFAEAGSNLTIIQSSVVIGAVQLFANVLTFFLIKRLGNKSLFEISLAGNAFGMIVLGVYNLNRKLIPITYNWIPIASFSFISFIGALGLNTVPFVLPFDILPIKIRGTVVTITMSLIWILGFALNLLYPIFTVHFGMHGSLFTFASICVIAMFITRFFVPETKGRAYMSIMELLER